MARYSITNVTAEQLESVGARNIKAPSRVPVVFAELTPAQVAKLQFMGCIISPVGKVQTSVMPPIPVAGVPTYTPEELVIISGFEEIRGLTDPPLYGEGYNIAIVGTGIRRTHNLINGRVVYSKNFTASPDGDQFDHDTGCASVALAVVPKCGLLDLKVFGPSGEGTEEEVVEAIDHCIGLLEQGSEFAPIVINLSLGSIDTGDPNSAMRIACRAAIEKKIWVIAAVGNTGPNPGTVTSPACEKYVGAIGSAKYLPAQESFVISDFSSRGPTLEGLTKPDCIAFGEDIEMASSASDTATTAKSGTSFSTPLISGIAVLYHEGELTYRRYIMIERVTGLPEEFFPLVTIERLIDYWLARMCIKPAGAPATKDNEYGEGLIFGPLTMRMLQAAVSPAFDIASLIGILPVMMMVGMMGVMVRGEK